MKIDNAVIPVVIPAFQPKETLLDLAEGLCRIGISDIVVVDDGNSQEGSGNEIFKKMKKMYGCEIVRHYVNMGKGRALKDGFNFCLCKYPNLIGCVTADADGQHTPEDIYRCMMALMENRHMLILGCRNFDQENIPLKSKLGNKITRNICRWFCGIKISDTQTGLRALPKEFMEHMLNIGGERFEFETNMLLESKARCEIKEIEIQTVYDSKENHETHFDPIKDSIRIYKILGKEFLRFLFSSFSSSLIDLALFASFVDVFKENEVLHYVTFATVSARVLSAVYNYIINYKIVFDSREKHRLSTSKYFALACIQMILSAILVTLGAGVFSFMPETGIKIAVDAVLFFLSYTIQRKYIFKV